MEWLIQNWIPLVVGIVFLILMRRGGMCCGGHRRERHTPTKDADAQLRQ